MPSINRQKDVRQGIVQPDSDKGRGNGGGKGSGSVKVGSQGNSGSDYAFKSAEEVVHAPIVGEREVPAIGSRKTSSTSAAQSHSGAPIPKGASVPEGGSKKSSSTRPGSHGGVPKGSDAPENPRKEKGRAKAPNDAVNRGYDH